MTVTYGITSSCALTKDLDLELPEAENIWGAMTADQ